MSVSGCFLAHSTEDEPRGGPGPAADAGPPRHDASRPLPTPGRDAGDPPPPLRCEPTRAQATCLESWLVPPGRAFELPMQFAGCGCCTEAECRVEATTILGQPVLQVETTLCPDPCDCDACYVPRVTCSVPPLAEGSWNVVVNGAPAFELPVFADSGLVPPPPSCATFAEPDLCALAPSPIRTSGWRPAGACVERGRENQYELVAVHHCWGCADLRGDCHVSLQPRFTDDLPPGGEIHVTPTSHPTACDVDCPEICARQEQRCILPPLVDGDYYRVWIDGTPMLQFTAGGFGSLACSPTADAGGGAR